MRTALSGTVETGTVNIRAGVFHLGASSSLPRLGALALMELS
jgi:hypothetical protein